MVKILLLQQWYNLSDPQIERKIRGRISFMNFLGYPEKLPDRNTIWYFRERLSKTGKYRLVFNEIRDQIMAKRIRIKKGTIQDASFIEGAGESMANPEERMQRPSDLRMVHQQRRIMRSISATRHIPS
jgi:IS5 family transposase